jgi:hypothetical protein
MGEWNDELEQLLTQAEEREWNRIISAKTIAMVPTAVVDMTDAKTMWEEAITKIENEEHVNNELTEECEQLRARAKMEQVCIIVYYGGFQAVHTNKILLF